MRLHCGRGLLKSENQMKLVGVSSLSVLLTTLVLVCCANAQNHSTFTDSMGFLSKEKSLAESYASILKQFGKENLKNYAEGIRLYANAKAEFDGLIEQLKFNLKKNKSLDESADFKAELNQAAEQRVAFTEFVTAKIIGDDPGRKNPLAIAAISAIPDLIKALTEVSNTIWKEYRSVRKELKHEILDQLSSMKWRNFSDIVGSG